MIGKIYSIIFVLMLIFFGCDSIPSEILDSPAGDYLVKKVTAPVNFVYSPSDSTIITSVEMENSRNILRIWSRTLSEDSKVTYYSFIELFDNGSQSASGDQTAGDNIYSAKIPMSLYFPSGKYIIEYYIEDDLGKSTKAAFKTVNYDNGLANSPPLVSDVIAPDTVIVQPPKSVFLVSVAVSDSNGYSDIKQAWFVTVRPNGTSSGQKTFLYDDGTNGDEVPFDGRFSLLIEVTPDNTKGRYRFDFQASDRGNKLSNILSHFIVIR